MRWLTPLWRRPRGSLDIAHLCSRFVAIDLETTGLDPRRDAIVAAAAVPFVDALPTEGLVTLVNPGRPIPASSSAIHGITDAMVAAAPSVDDLLPALAAAWGDTVLIGHGVDFDLAVIGRERRARRLPALANPSLDTMRLAAALNRSWGDVSLDAVAARLGIPIVGRHTARGDAVAAGHILLKLLPALTRRGLRTVGDVVWFQQSVSLRI
jgi:DNA polymerase-3 subunit epsilon